jgi:hypothetical protein
MSSYQKLKQKYEARINELTKDIITLVEEKDINEVIITKTKWKIQLDMEKVIWSGDASK